MAKVAANSENIKLIIRIIAIFTIENQFIFNN